jgi:small GTP-binding protein|tara:strand:- start:1967 stop:2545 length:579 start_codon:yes stop_codon:yes gene_type:complete
MSYDYCFKLLIIGGENSGKSSICKKKSLNYFNPYYNETIGIEFSTCSLEICDQVQIKCQLWDTSGNKRFYKLVEKYFKNNAGIIIVFDITNRKSFDRVGFWLNKIDHKTKILLLGNKVDKEGERKVSFEEATAYAKQRGIPFFETSAKENINIDESLKKFCQIIYNNYIEQGSTGIIKLKKSKDTNHEWCCC